MRQGRPQPPEPRVAPARRRARSGTASAREAARARRTELGECLEVEVVGIASSRSRQAAPSSRRGRTSRRRHRGSASAHHASGDPPVGSASVARYREQAAVEPRSSEEALRRTRPGHGRRSPRAAHPHEPGETEQDDQHCRATARIRRTVCPAGCPSSPPRSDLYGRGERREYEKLPGEPVALPLRGLQRGPTVFSAGDRAASTTATRGTARNVASDSAARNRSRSSATTTASATTSATTDPRLNVK